MGLSRKSHVETLLSRIHDPGAVPAIVWGERTVTHAELATSVWAWDRKLASLKINSGRVVFATAGYFSPESVAVFWLCSFALHCCSSCNAGLKQNPRLLETAQATALVTVNSGDTCEARDIEHPSDDLLIEDVRASGRPAIALFSSGSTGESKASLHDVDRWIERFEGQRKPRRTLSFLLFDHGGGFNTLLATLTAGGVGRSRRARCRYDLLPYREAVHRAACRHLPSKQSSHKQYNG